MQLTVKILYCGVHATEQIIFFNLIIFRNRVKRRVLPGEGEGEGGYVYCYMCKVSYGQYWLGSGELTWMNQSTFHLHACGGGCSCIQVANV